MRKVCHVLGGVALFGGGRSVVQCGVADDAERLSLGGGDSPWAHDLPIAAPAPLPAAWATAAAASAQAQSDQAQSNRSETDQSPSERPPAVDPLERDTPVFPLAGPEPSPIGTRVPAPEHRHRRTALVIGLVGLLMAAVIGSQLARGGDDPTSADDESATTVTSGTSGTTAATETTAATQRTTPPIVFQSRPPPRPTTTVGDRLPPPPPEWVASTVALSPRIAAIAAPTQVVALGRDGTLHLIDTSTGMMHSIDTGTAASNLMLSLGAHDVLLSSYDRSEVTLARVREPPTQVDLEGGVARVIHGTGDDDFIIVPNTWNPESPDLLRLGSDDQPVTVSTGPLLQFDPWQIQFLATTGQMIVNDTGGVYLIDDNGAATRISTGDLVFLGPNHFVVRECDGALACAYVRVDQATGQRDIVELGDLGLYRQWGDLSSWSLSPDGTGVTYFDWQNGGPLPARRLVDLASGTNVQVESGDQYNFESAWAADSSGLFVIADRTVVFYDRANGQQIPVAPDAGLDDIVAVATRPITD